MMKGAKQMGAIEWGKISVRSQYALIMLATAFTWMMGLMGYIRSSVRLFWHVNEIMRDNSPWAYTHTVGFAANMISFNVLFFWVSILFVFWLGSLGVEEGACRSKGRGSGRRTAAGWGPLIIFSILVRGGRHEAVPPSYPNRRRLHPWAI